MRCRRCQGVMVETRKESSSASEQVWFGCPACDTIKMQTQPRPSGATQQTDEIIDDAIIELTPDQADQIDTHESDDNYVSPLSYSASNN